MKLELNSPKAWKIPKDFDEIFHLKEIEKLLCSINRTGKGNCIIMDYFRQKLIVDSFLNSKITGYSKDAVEKEGLNFHDRIFSRQEQDWLHQMHKAAFKIFYDYPVSKRYDLEFYYDLISQTSKGTELILHHKLVPLKLDENGNMWLGLCSVTPSTSVRSPKASIIDIQTCDKYNFVNGKFQLSSDKVLTQEDVMILGWLAKDLTTKAMCLKLGISENKFNRKKKKIYSLLDVQSAGGAIYKAQIMELI
jgi:DNA-binding CsgD family transcriptional regulator